MITELNTVQITVWLIVIVNSPQVNVKVKKIVMN